MTTTLAHTFDCDCATCIGSDVAAVGMDLFRKPKVTVTAPVAISAETKTLPSRHLMAGQKVGNGRVRKISERQEWFINKLIGERDLTDLKLATNQTLDATEIPYMGLPAAKALIEKLLGMPIKGTNSPVKESNQTIPGSPKQIDLINSLAKERNLSESDIKIMLKAKPTARLLIDALFAMPKPNKAAQLKEEISKASNNEEYVPTEIIPGFYRDTEGQVWKVQFNQAQTGMYALKRINKKKYEYTTGAIKTLTPEMFVSINPLDITLEEAKAYGRKTGTCYMCSRELTKQESIDKGIGPICESKF